jgi:hypothetical protein
MSKTGRQEGRHGYPSEPPPLYHGGSLTANQLPPGRKVGRNGSTTMAGEEEELMMMNT